jgi:hypothetical protein
VARSAPGQPRRLPGSHRPPEGGRTLVADHVYRDQGFGFCGFCEWIADYPSAALFQKPIDEIKPVEDILFREADER